MLPGTKLYGSVPEELYRGRDIGSDIMNDIMASDSMYGAFLYDCVGINVIRKVYIVVRT